MKIRLISMIILTAGCGFVLAMASAAEPPQDSARVEVTCLVPKTVPAFASQTLELRLYKHDPMIADKPADLVEKVEISDFSHAQGQETKKTVVIGAQAKLDATMRYYLSCFVLDKNGQRTHMGELSPRSEPAKVLTQGHPRAVTLTLRKLP